MAGWYKGRGVHASILVRVRSCFRNVLFKNQCVVLYPRLFHRDISISYVCYAFVFSLASVCTSVIRPTYG